MATQVAEGPKGEFNSMIGLLFVLTLCNGIVGFDRLTVSFLAPFIVADLGLNNEQVGWIASALSLAIAISSFFGSQLADRSGKRKLVLIVCMVLFSLLSGAAGLATSFVVLLACRFALGAVEGPLVPISQTFILQASSPKWRGFNMGFMQMVGAFGIAGFIGPVVATQLGSTHGWRTVMFLSIIPGLLVAALMMLMIRSGTRTAPAEARPPRRPLLADFAELLRLRNIRVSLVIAGLITAWLVLQSTFLTLFLTEVKGLAPTTAGWVIGLGGWAGLVGGISLPALSDRVGRKPVLLYGSLAATIGPIAMLVLPDNLVLLALTIFVGWLPLGIAPLYCAAVPTECAPAALATTAVGLAMGWAELFGGVILPPIAGRAADAFGLEAGFVICIALALASAVAALFLRETAPAKVGREET